MDQTDLRKIFEILYENHRFDCVFIKNQKENIYKKKNIFFKYFDSKDKYKEDLSYRINIETDWENFLDKKKERKIKLLNKNIKKNLGSNLNYKINESNLDFNEKTEIVNFIIKKKREQLNRTKIFHYLNDTKYESFLKKLFLNSSSDLIKYSYLKKDNKLLAAHIGFNFKKTFYYMFPVYDYEFKKLSAGRFLLTKLIENSFKTSFVF